MRKINKDLDKLVEGLRRLTGRKLFIVIDGSPARPMLCERFTHTFDNSGQVEISPRLTTTQLCQWIEAFNVGFEAGAEWMKAGQ